MGPSSLEDAVRLLYRRPSSQIRLCMPMHSRGLATATLGRRSAAWSKWCIYVSILSANGDE